jgi:hypothetical protein
MSWFLDFVGYQYSGIHFVIKEIAILNTNGDRCYNYFITGPKTVYPMEHFQTVQYQYQMHQLRWEFGDYQFNEAMMDIARKLRSDPVFIKGNEKWKFISSMFPSPTFIELKDVPAFKSLNSCVHERCEVKHGNHCARRKVYELMHFISQNQDLSQSINRI